ncbi:MAG: hypothetical protein Q4F72_01275 [Desulfovibrionaceae bacterium]|nr:hypothetical protein [Desulfovibrionaceae bacterium]
MAAFANTLWWVAFLVAGIIVQAALPGLDALLLGLILIAEEKDYRTMVWFVPSVILLQEGMGTQPFGAAMVCVTLCLILFRMCARMAMASRAGFVLLLSLSCGGVRILVDWFFANLEGLPYAMEELIAGGVHQSVYLLAGWEILRRVRIALLGKRSAHEA